MKIFFWKYLWWNIFSEIFLTKHFFKKNCLFFQIYFENIFDENIFDKNIFCENIFDNNIFCEYIFGPSIWSLRVFPLLTKVPLLHMIHSFEVKCDERTHGMSVPFIVLDDRESNL